jgi:hypothetical protein
MLPIFAKRGESFRSDLWASWSRESSPPASDHERGGEPHKGTGQERSREPTRAAPPLGARAAATPMDAAPPSEAALIEVDLRDRFGFGGIEGGRLVEVERRLGIEVERGLGRPPRGG